MAIQTGVPLGGNMIIEKFTMDILHNTTIIYTSCCRAKPQKYRRANLVFVTHGKLDGVRLVWFAGHQINTRWYWQKQWCVE